MLIGIFVYGTAGADQGHAQRAEEQGEHDQGWCPPCKPSGIRHSEELWFEGTSEEQCPRAIRSSIARMHLNLAHIPRPDLIRLLVGHGANSTALAAANALRCASCLRKVSPRQRLPRPSTRPRLGQFNDRIQADVVTCVDAAGTAHKYFGIIDLATLYHICVYISNRESITTFNSIATAWKSLYGLPHTIIVDEDGSFKGEFLEAMNDMLIALDFIPPDAHYQLGTIERHNRVWCSMYHKVVDRTGALTDQQLLIAALMTNHAKNTMFKRRGRSPSMAVFGRHPRLPHELLSDEASMLTFPDFSLTEQQQFSDWCRIESVTAFAEYEAEQQVRKSMLRQTRDPDRHELEPGQKVGFFRSQTKEGAFRKAGSTTRRAGYLIGTLIGRQAAEKGHNYFVQYGGHQYLVSPENIRPAVGFEHWTPSQEDMDALHKAEEDLARDDFTDITRDRPPDDAEPRDPEIALDPSGIPSSAKHGGDPAAMLPPTAADSPRAQAAGGTALLPNASALPANDTSAPERSLETVPEDAGPEPRREVTDIPAVPTPRERSRSPPRPLGDAATTSRSIQPARTPSPRSSSSQSARSPPTTRPRATSSVPSADASSSFDQAQKRPRLDDAAILICDVMGNFHLEETTGFDGSHAPPEPLQPDDELGAPQRSHRRARRHHA